MPTAPFLRLSGVSKRFGGVLALDRIDWDVLPGEVHCLVGENGCGKSTLIKLVAGVHQPDPGSEIEIGGAVRTALGPAEAKALGIQVIYQDLSLFPNLSVAENIAFDQQPGGPRPPGPLRPDARDRARAAAAAGRRAAARAPVGSLSIAERQVVAICRGLAADAKLLFMDEPTASLTRAEVNALLGFVERAASRGRGGGVRQSPARRGGRDRRARDGHARRPQGRHLRRRRGRRAPDRRADDRAGIDQAITARDVARRAPLLEVRG